MSVIKLKNVKRNIKSKSANLLRSNLRSLLFAGISLIFISCGNLFNPIDSDSSSGSGNGGVSYNTNTITFTGTVPDVTGALPSSVSQSLNSTASHSANGGIFSSALPSLNFTNYEYFARAKNENNVTINGTFGTDATSSTFTIPLEVGHTWTITAGLKSKTSERIIMADSYTIDPPLSNENPVTNHTFTLLPYDDSEHPENNKGDILLSMTVPSSVGSVTAECSDENWIDAVASSLLSGVIGLTNPIVTLTLPNIKVGNYELTLKFYDSVAPDSGNPDTRSLLFSTTQSISVFPGLRTDTWRSDGTALFTTSGGTTTFNLTGDIINGFLDTTIYVGIPAGLASNPNVTVTASDTNSGHAYSPLATLESALSKIEAAGNNTKDYRIFVSGTHTGSHTIPAAITASKAKSITIEGLTGLNTDGVPQDVLDAGGTEGCGSVLTVNTAVPVTIKKLKITGGSSNKGGGIALMADTTLTLDGGTLVTGNSVLAGGSGGGISVGGGSTASKGGKLILKDCKIYANTVENGWGGGIFCEDASYNCEIEIKGNSVEIYNNEVTNNQDWNGQGGGIAIGNLGTVIMSAGKIYGNTGYTGGGVKLMDEKAAFIMTGGQIYGNTANRGGGVHNSCNTSAASGKTYGFTMSGGKIYDNTASASTSAGGALFNAGIFQIKGSAYLPYGVTSGGTLQTGSGKNDLYLASGKNITITGALNPPSQANGKVAVISLDEYVSGRQVLTLATSPSPATTLAAEYSKFSLADESTVEIKKSGKTGSAGVTTQFYVSSSGSDTNEGSVDSPFATITQALKEITAQATPANYTINITGTLNGAQVIPASDTSDAENPITLNADTVTSLTLCGVPDTSATLNGGFTNTTKGTTLTISTEQPVTIKDLTITGGFANHGSGVYVDTNANVLITTGTQIINNQNTGSDFSYGGGIYSKGTLTINGGIINHNVCYNGGGVYIAGGKAFIYGNIMIGEDDATFTEADKIPTASSCGNRVKQAGGGIYVDKGLLAIGYSAYTSETDNTPAEFTGKICRNYAELATGGINISSTGTAVIDSGTISYNATPSDRYGGGIGVSGTGGSLTMTGGNIEHNTTGYGAGIWLYANAKATIRGGLISYNTATHSSKGGGGIYLEKSSSYSATLNLYGGTISNNSATASGLGGAIYVDNGPSFNIKGSAYIPYGVEGETGAGKNDIYLAEGRIINIAGQLTPPAACTDGIVAALNPVPCSNGRQVLTLVSGVTDTTLASEYQKFALTYEGTDLHLDSTGYLALDGDLITEFFVSYVGSDDNDGAASSTAFATITKALKRITAQGRADKDYTINVIGPLTGAQSIPASDAANNIAINAQTAKSITLCGEGLGPELDGGFDSSNKGTTLTISTAQPVTIKDLTIKGGYATSGGGLYVDDNTNVLITDGVNVIENSASSCGGGIYSKGTLSLNGAKVNQNIAESGGGIYIDGGKVFIYGDTMIGEDDSAYSEDNKLATSSSYGNKANSYCGGIYNDRGLLAIGYSSYTSETDNTPAEFTGKICRNYAGTGTGGITSRATTVIGSGTISYNNGRSDGGGVTVCNSSSSTFIMNGGSIEHNKANYGAGLYITEKGNVTINGGSISYNTAANSSYGGGGIYLNKSSSDSATLNIYGGTISNNTAASGKGGAIYAMNGCSFNMKGSAYIPYGVYDESGAGETGAGKNDLYLTDGMTVNIAGQLTPPSECTDGIVAAITPQTYTAGTSLFTLASSPDPTTTLDAECGKFKVVPSDSTGEWGISEEGKLASGIPASSAAETIHNLASSGSVTIYGCVSTDQLQAIAAAIKALPSNVNVYLDLSQTSLTEIPDNAFKNCARLTGVDFPSGITSIGANAFYCAGLTSIHIPDSVTLLGNSAFEGCSGITSYTLPNNDSVIYQNRIFAGWNFTELVVTKGSFTGSAVIAEIQTLTTVTLPADLGNHPVIYGCPNITTINYLGTRSQWDANKSTWLGNYTGTQQNAITVHCSDDD